MIDKLLGGIERVGNKVPHPAILFLALIGTVIVLSQVLTMVVNLIIPQAIAKWALLAPIFIPLFMRLGVEPQTVLAAYRVGDSPTNVITPIMASSR